MGLTRDNSLWICATLVVLVFAVYGQVVTFDFTNYDDPEYIITNSHIAKGFTLENLSWAFTSGYASNWLPLTWISHMMDVQLFGMNSGMHHLTSLIFHALSSILLFVLLKRMTGAFWRSALVAGLFALHPLRVESVAWLAQRKDALSTFFWMITLWNYARYAERPGVTRYLLIVLTFVLGLMAKPLLVTLPWALLLLDVWPLQRMSRKSVWPLLIEKLPLFALSIAVTTINYLVQDQAGSVVTLGTVPLWLRLENAVISYAAYLGMMIWPRGLAPFYPLPLTIPLWQPVMAGLIVGAISVFVFRERNRRPYLPVGWLLYLGTLVPVLGLVLVGAQSRADRYTYVPGIGILIMVVWGVADLIQAYPRIATPVRIGAAAALAACVIMTAIQVSYWRDSITLFQRTIAVSENNYVAYNNLGVALNKRGEVDEAIVYYKMAIETPHYFNVADPYVNMGAAMLTKEQPAEAVPYLLKALEHRPQSAVAHTNLGLALDDLGRSVEAVDHFRVAIRIEPENVEAQSGMGVALAKTGNRDEALTHIREALKIRPNFAGGYFDLGEIYGSWGQLVEAEKAFRESIRLDPSNARAQANLGIALGGQGNLPDAISAFREAVRLKPDYAMAWFNLGIALAHTNLMKDAADAFAETVRLQPDFEDARNALARANTLLQQARR